MFMYFTTDTNRLQFIEVIFIKVHNPGLNLQTTGAQKTLKLYSNDYHTSRHLPVTSANTASVTPDPPQVAETDRRYTTFAVSPEQSEEAKSN